MPVKAQQESGPNKWATQFLEARYTTLGPVTRVTPEDEQKAVDIQAAAVKELAAKRTATDIFTPISLTSVERPSSLQPGQSMDNVLAKVPATYWSNLLLQYRQRKVQARAALTKTVKGTPVTPPPPSAGVPGTSNWIPIGPSAVAHGQPDGRPTISGRASGIAIAPSVSRIYVCTADGGVWRSDTQGVSWYSTMDSFDEDPTTAESTSLACGAIAIDQADPDRVYVGTGEGDTNAIFSQRLINALPCYRGVGAIRSDDGGQTWVNEPTAPGSPTLAGGAFFSLAVDPGNRENVVAGTNVGLYRRVPAGSTFQWVALTASTTTNIYPSVAVANTGGVTTFYAAAWGDQVYKSTDGGATWAAAGTGFPAGTTRIGLAMQRNNPNTLYAMTCDSGAAYQGVYRLDNGTGAWHSVSGGPTAVLGGQGTYDLTIAVDPNNVDVIYMGGQAVLVTNYNGAIYRAQVSGTAPPYSMSPTFIGLSSHPDVHMLLHAPGDSSTLFCCCDGGIFKTVNATGAANFTACNTDLATVSTIHLSQHPTQPAVIFAGLQDNGSVRYTGEECWLSDGQGDGGYCLINWNNPFEVITYADGSLQRATDGGQDYTSLTDITPPTSWQIMDEPFVSAPYNPSSPSDANVIAFGAGDSLFISSDFGTTWLAAITVPLGSIFALAFASATRLFLGTTTGNVYRYDKSGSTWNATRLDNAVGGALPLTGLITDVEIDLADATLASIYLSFGGTGDYRHVWHFDGTKWTARSGPSAGASTSLLDVEHNALAVDPSNHATVFVGADIGVWKSTDSGSTWTVIENGLPDAAVLDLAIHQPSRLLRAALQGRGVFQYKLDPPVPADTELYIRDTDLDLGLVPTVDGLPDPADPPTTKVAHWESPNIKVDVPTPAGYQTTSKQIDFEQFNYTIVDGSQGVATIATGTVTNRVYVEIHNRGITPATSVRIMLLLADAAPGLPSLPAGYTAHVTAGTPFTTASWQTVGFQTISNLVTGFPQVAEFDLPSTMLPPPASLPGQSHYCLLALLDSSQDAFTSTQTGTDALTIADRKVGQRNLNIVAFVGTPPPPSSGVGQLAQLFLQGAEADSKISLVVDLAGYPGQVGVSLPTELATADVLKGLTLDKASLLKTAAGVSLTKLKAPEVATGFNAASTAALVDRVTALPSQPLILYAGGKTAAPLTGLALKANTSYPVFLHISAPEGAKTGDSYKFQVSAQDDKGNTVGGCSYIVEFV